MTAATVPDVRTVPARAPGLVRSAARIAALELRLLLREPGVLVGLVAFPAATVLILAGVFGSTPDPEFGGVRPSEHYVVGYLGVVFAQVGLVSLPVHLASHRELGVTRRYRASGSPVPRRSSAPPGSAPCSPSSVALSSSWSAAPPTACRHPPTPWPW